MVLISSRDESTAVPKPKPKPKLQKQRWASIERFEAQQRKQEESDRALMYAGTPDNPYVQKLTPREQAIKDDIERKRAEGREYRWKFAQSLGISEAEFEKCKKLGIDIEKVLNGDDDVIHTGPRGGRYRMTASPMTFSR